MVEAFRKLSLRDIDQLPVLEGDRLVGLLRRADLMRWLEMQAPSSAQRAL
jgi:hypothetical protein